MECFDRFVAIIAKLRAPGGCPWDIEQTFESLTPHIIEEAYELADVMRREDAIGLQEELGDVLLHVIMLSGMAAEKGWFTVSDVIEDVTEKMIRRHPHVFGDVLAKSSDDVISNWDQIKTLEKAGQTSIFESIPVALPSLMRALKIQKRASREGFDWDSIEGPLAKLKEEVAELESSVLETPNTIEEELGDVLFSMVNVARHLSVLPEEALQKANEKFMKRYALMGQLIKQDGYDIGALSLDKKETYWTLAKQILAKEALE
jgi:MazG family protein